MIIQSIVGTPNQRPHMRFLGQFPLASATQNNTLFVGDDTKLYYEDSSGNRKAYDDLLPIIKKTGVSFNTSGVAGKSFINVIDADVNVNSVINITLDAFINDLSILHIAAGAGQYTIYYDYVAAVVNVPYNITII